MKILLSYLKAHRKIVVFALFLAAMNIGFSLIDPYISGRILDVVIRQSDKLAFGAYLGTVLKLVGAAIGVAMVSRIAKNFQDYYTNIITQKTGAKMYADGLKHSLELPYQVFEDQRSGETLGILQKSTFRFRSVYYCFYRDIVCEFNRYDLCYCVLVICKL